MANELTHPVTLSTVARYAGVSTSTVSRVLNNKGELSEETRRKVFDAIQTLGYRPSLVAQGLRKKDSHLIGLMLPEILSPIFAELALGVEMKASEANYTVAHSNTLYSPEREKSGLLYLLDRYVDGVVCYSPHLPENELIPLLNQIGASVVVNLPVPDSQVGELYVDNVQGMRMVITHLVEQGYKKIAYFALSSSSWNGREREKAFIQTLHDLGLPFEPRMILNIDRDLEQNNQQTQILDYSLIPIDAIENGEWAARRFLEMSPDLDAIIAFNDLCAVGILRTLIKAGRRVPEEIAVVGFDNSVIGSKFMPSLTTAGMKNVDIGRQAAQMLIDHLEGQIPLQKINLPFTLYPRESTLRKTF
jgi:LacI family transcriptional regulator